MGIWKGQSNFSKGELDPLVKARDDLEVMYQGVETGYNVLAIPQGGLTRRYGTEFIVDGGVNLTDSPNQRLESFSFDQDQNHMFLFQDKSLKIYSSGILIQTLVTPITNRMIADMDYIQRLDSSIVTHEDLYPQLIQHTLVNQLVSPDNFGSSDWTETPDINITADVVADPDGNFTGDLIGTVDSNGKVEQTVAFAANTDSHVFSAYVKDSNTSVSIGITFAGGTAASHWASYNFDTEVLTDSGGTADSSITLIGDGWYRIMLEATSVSDTSISAEFFYVTACYATWAQLEFDTDIAGAADYNATTWTIGNAPLTNIPQHNFSDTYSPEGTDCIQVLNFANHNSGDRYKISLEGIITDEIVYADDDDAHISNIVDALQALPNTGGSGISAVTTTPTDTYTITFGGDSANDWEAMTASKENTQSASFGAATTISQAGVSPAEDVWSDSRGYPRTCTFHEGRLWFGGSKSQSHTLWGSHVNDQFNFNVGKSRDNETIIVTLDTDQLNSIQGIVSNRTLQVFTTGAEFYVPESPITPENVAVQPQTNLGSKRVRPVVLDGRTFFIQKNGKALYEFVYADAVQAVESRSISIAAPHLIKNPTKMVVLQSTTNSDASYVFMVSNDGNLTVLNTQATEGIQAFTNWECSGSIKDVTVIGEDVYILREPSADNDDDTLIIDKINIDMYMDSEVSQTVTGTSVTGLDHLDGETVQVKVDGVQWDDATVASGAITLPETVTAATVEVGLEYNPEIKTMPIHLALNSGSTTFNMKRIIECGLRLFESTGVLVDSKRIPDKTIGVDQFDAPAKYTGLKKMRVSGWSYDAQVSITQTTPFPMTVLGITLEVKV